MITHLTGTLVAIEDGAAHVRSGDLTYEVLVPEGTPDPLPV